MDIEIPFHRWFQPYVLSSHSYFCAIHFLKVQSYYSYIFIARGHMGHEVPVGVIKLVM